MSLQIAIVGLPNVGPTSLKLRGASILKEIIEVMLCPYR